MQLKRVDLLGLTGFFFFRRIVRDLLVASCSPATTQEKKKRRSSSGLGISSGGVRLVIVWMLR